MKPTQQRNLQHLARLVPCVQNAAVSLSLVVGGGRQVPSKLNRVLRDLRMAPAAQRSRDLLRGFQATGLALVLLLGNGSAEALADEYGPRRNTTESAQVASVFEDNLKTVLRQVDSALESALGNAIDGILGEDTDPASVAEKQALARKLIQEIWEIVDETYSDIRNGGFDREKWKALRDEALNEKYNDVSAVHRAARRMIATGLADPYTRYITPNEFTAMLKYDITGVGLNLVSGEEFSKKVNQPLPEGRSPSGIFVLGVIKSSTADKGGIAEGDEIIQVDDTKLDQRTPFQAASLIQGGDDEASTPTQPTTTLTVRKPNGTVLQVELARPEKPVSKSPVTYRMERSPGENKTGYIQLTGFNAQAQRKVKEAVVALEKDGAKRLILDLRDNRGGLVSEGIEVARLFLDNESVVVVTEGRAKSSDKPITAPGPALTKLPMVVLVNEHTASASEILAGSLRDNCRAVVAGTRTYGKGLIQSVYELGDGSGLVVTVGKYLTPGLTDIDQSGIVPDFKSVPAVQAAQDTLKLCKVPKA